MTISRRGLLGGVLAAGSLALTPGLLAAQSVPVQVPPASSQSPAGEQAAQVVAIARALMEQRNLRAVILRVLVDGQELVTDAFGESMTGVPATPDMHFRNGAVAISYMSTLLLRLVDQGVVSLDDTLATWLPELPLADSVTLRMLANMTSGYADYVPDAGFTSASYANPFREWTPQELIDVGIGQPHVFQPGTSWNYAHTNYVILGQALQRITGQPLNSLLRRYVLDPLGLRQTDDPGSAQMPAPVLHAFSSERRAALGIPSSARFYEESTFWSPSWTLAQGAIQYTNIYDMAATAVGVGTGALLSAASHQAQVDPGLLGFGHPQAGCPGCRTLDQFYNYGLGVVLNGSWQLQNPLFGGYAAVEAYLPSKKIALALATTFDEQSFDDKGNYLSGSAAQEMYAAIGGYLAPDDPPPHPPANS
ncbi:MAG: beta-lactamase family protein [Chloroflexi bacterium]|nr:beta-lactamase family protein [Chloroflexota bacterium]